MSSISVQVPFGSYKLLNTDPNSNYDFRGALYYNGYYYSIGDWTQSVYDPTLRTYHKGVIMKIARTDMSTVLTTAIKSAAANEASMYLSTNQMCRVGDFIYFPASWASVACGMVQYDIATDTYKMWKLAGSGLNAIATDGTYLYTASGTTVNKFLEADFRDSCWTEQFNTNFDSNGAITLRASYSFNGLGGYPADNSKKGEIHELEIDSSDTNILWVIFGISGTTVGKAIECHQMNLTSFTSTGWVHIPNTMGKLKSGLFSAQNSTWLFIPVQLRTNATSDEYGYNWTLVAIKKLDMTSKPLVRMGGTDTASTIYSCGATLVNSNLFLYKNNYTTYSIDISDPDSWLDTDAAGSHVLDVIMFYVQGTQGGAYNELGANYQRKPAHLILDSYGQWFTPAYYGDCMTPSNGSVMRFVIPGYDFTPPTVANNGASTTGIETILSGHISAGGTGLTACGIRWGYTPGDLSTVVATTGTDFSITLSDLASGTYYYQSYATNANGTGESSIETFTVTGNDKAPTVIAKEPITGNFTIQLRGEVEHINGQAQSAVGFMWGLTADSLTNVITCPSALSDFDTTLTSLPVGTYYYKAFADNSVGRGFSSVTTFEVTKYLRIDIADADKITFDGQNSFPFAHYIHGSLFYNGHVYGSARNVTNPITTDLGNIVKINAYDYSAAGVTNIPIRYLSDTDTSVIIYMDQIVRVGNYIYALGETQETPHHGVLVQLDTTDDSWKIFAMDAEATAPIVADDRYLYITGHSEVWKYLAADFQNPDYPKYNTSEITVPLPAPVATFDHMAYGELFEVPYSSPKIYQSLNKGTLHSGLTDSNYLWLAFTTGSDNTRYELQKVDKHTMTGVSWCLIPKSTDDMCQSATHLFFGIEVQPTAPAGTYGKGYGTFAVRKSDLNLTALPKYDTHDGTGSDVTSYASLIFGNYLLDQKTNGFTYILDITDVDSWSITDPVGTAVLHILGFYSNGIRNQGYHPTATPPTYDKPPNDLVLNETTGEFHTFLWGTNSGLMKFTVPNPPYSFVGEPIVDTVPAEVTGTGKNAIVILNGGCLNNNGSALSDTGFEWGNSIAAISSHQVLTGATDIAWSIQLGGINPGTYYYRALAINSVGTGYGDILSFVVPAPTGPTLYIGTIPILSLYLGTIPIITLY